MPCSPRAAHPAGGPTATRRSGRSPSAWLKVKAPDAAHRIDHPVRNSTYERDYELRIRRHAIPYLGDIAIGRIDSLVLKAWLRWCADTGRSDDTASRALARVKLVLRWAMSEGMIAGDRYWEVVTGPVAESSVRPGVIHDTDMATMGAIMRAVEGHYLGVMYEIELILGPRPGELRGLLAENVDHERHQIHLQHTLDWASGGVPLLEDTKTAAGFRTIGLPDSLWTRFEAHLADRDRSPVHLLRAGEWVEADLVFRRRNGRALRGDGTGGTNDLFKRCLARAGLPAQNAYSLRHLAVGLLLTIGRPDEVAQIVGHSSYRLTLDRYAPRMRELLERTAIDLEPIFRHLAAIGYSPAKVSDEVSGDTDEGGSERHAA